MYLVHPNAEQKRYLKLALNKNNVQESVQELKEWLKNEPHLPDSWDEDCLRTFFKGCKCCLKTTKKKLDMYFTVRATMPEFFSDRNINNEELATMLNYGDGAVMPFLTAKGSRISILKPDKDLPDLPNLNDFIKIVFMVGDLRIKYERGVTDLLIIDLNFPIIRHFYKVPLATVQNFFNCVRNAYPIEVTEIHLVNASSFVYHLINFVRPFLGEKLRNCIHVHTAVNTLYDFVPKDLLPEDYGGFGGTLKEWKEKCVKFMDDNTWWFQQEETIKANLAMKKNKNNNTNIYEETLNFVEFD